MTNEPSMDVPGVVFTPAITPENLGALIHNEKLGRPVRVRGYATDLRVCEDDPEHYRCGRLTLDDSSIAFRVRADTLLAEGEPAVIVGVLHVNSKRWALELRGHFESAWRPAPRVPVVVIPPRQRLRVSLTEFARHHSVTALGFLATKTGWDEMYATGPMTQLAQCHRVPMSFTDEDRSIESVTWLARLPAIKAIAVVRGAGEKLTSLGNSPRLAKALVETGLPFYVALGCPGDVLLLDKHADECFVAAPDFASHLRDLERERVGHQNADSMVQQLRAELVDIKQSMRDTEVRHGEALQSLQAQHASDSRHRMRNMIVAAMLMVLGLLLWELL
ncbi:hypothetical protein DWU98_07200 [Dyella monticola]|uniref:Uncharacterized protein n=2 Tax=Dyella monticola TaxID=1927958 RepID=A0A370X3W7_9GAMM|nr:hypothetical protein DWU98_07200 [Dyella monticola]